jgi:hypothetical protein
MKNEKISPIPNEPTRTFENQRMWDIFPIEKSTHITSVYGPILLRVSNDAFAELTKVPAAYLYNDARWNIVRLGRAKACKCASGFEGYVYADDEPLRTLVDICKKHIAFSFNDNHGTDPDTILPQKERAIRRFIEKLRQHQQLTTEEINRGTILLATLVGRLKGHESSHKAESGKKLKEFRRQTNRHAKMIHPQLHLKETRQVPTALQIEWKKAPTAITADIPATSEIVSEKDVLILELLAELGRFGSFPVRNWMDKKNRSRTSFWR